MKIYKQFLIILPIVIVLALTIPAVVTAAPIMDGRTVIGETFTLESGQILDGDLNVFGGVVNIQSDAQVNGSVFVLGGLVTINGSINGDLTAIGGTVNLEEDAVIEGNLISPASYINIDDNAVIKGDQLEGWGIPWTGMDLPFVPRPRAQMMPRLRILPVLNWIGRQVALILVMVGLGSLLLLVMPKATEQMSMALISKPWHAFGYGALTAVVMLFGGLMLSITICLIPIVIIVGLVFALAVLVGWLVLGYELGKRIAASIFNTSWHPVLTAAIGNLALYLASRGVGLIPCLGGFINFLVMLFGLGMVVVTLFGTNPYPRGEGVSIEEPVILLGSDAEKSPEKAEEAEKEEPPIVTPAPVDEAPFSQISPQDEPIETLNLGTRAENVLMDAGLISVGDVLNRLVQGDQAMLDIDGFGKKSLDDLKTALQLLGFPVDNHEE